MISISIPGFADLALHYLVLDYNGTLALDGLPVPGLHAHIMRLAQHIEIHVLTADTNRTCAQQMRNLPLTVSIIAARPEDDAKRAYIDNLGPEKCVCIGNGVNDRLMLKACALGIAVMGGEGTAVPACMAADIVAPGIIQALHMLENPTRLLATLRN